MNLTRKLAELQPVFFRVPAFGWTEEPFEPKWYIWQTADEGRTEGGRTDNKFKRIGFGCVNPRLLVGLF